MINPDNIIMHCSNMSSDTIKGCDGEWVILNRQDVKVLLDLKRDEYQFFANCPKCGRDIYNSRRAF